MKCAKQEYKYNKPLMEMLVKMHLVRSYKCNKNLHLKENLHQSRKVILKRITKIQLQPIIIKYHYHHHHQFAY